MRRFLVIESHNFKRPRIRYYIYECKNLSECENLKEKIEELLWKINEEILEKRAEKEEINPVQIYIMAEEEIEKIPKEERFYINRKDIDKLIKFLEYYKESFKA